MRDEVCEIHDERALRGLRWSAEGMRSSTRVCTIESLRVKKERVGRDGGYSGTIYEDRADGELLEARGQSRLILLKWRMVWEQGEGIGDFGVYTF